MKVRPPQTSRSQPDHAATNTKTAHLIHQSYKEEEARESEPEKRSVGLILETSRCRWHVTVAFRIPRTRTIKKRKRQEDLKNLCCCIDYDHIQLLDNTVTELLISRCQEVECQRLPLKAVPDEESEHRPSANSLWLFVREDPSRVRYPLYNGSNTYTKDVAEIRKDQELAPGVHKVRLDNDDKPYVYKEIKRPLYEPRDSEVLEQELLNLERFRNAQAIVRLIAPVVSQNPYQSAKSHWSPVVLQGILLEYHPHSTLHKALQTSTPENNLPWRRWSIQITKALAQLHQSDITHMDLKPSNVVIDRDHNAVLIDISGIGGVTPQWLAPEMCDVDDVLSQDTVSRKLNDIWALGKMLSTIANVSRDAGEKHLLERVGTKATAEVPALRVSLSDAICMLSELDQYSSQSTSSGSNPPSVRAPTERLA